MSARQRGPLLDFVVSALESAGCHILRHSEPSQAPFRITFETPDQERLGILVYAFTANSRLTKNRPSDEHRFQLKYGTKDGKYHALWQDPYLLYTTLLVGIDTERGVFVGADPVLHSPTRLFISVEFKRAHVENILERGWHSWERETRPKEARPQDSAGVEVLVGGTASNFLKYVQFEREALGEDQGHRMLLAERPAGSLLPPVAAAGVEPPSGPPASRLHALAREFDMSEGEVLDLIASARRLKMAVRGWVAEEHLVRRLGRVPGVSACSRLDEEGGPDVRLVFEGAPLTVECKNVLRQRTAAGLARIDFQRTRASKGDPSSRFYAPSEFDVVAACLHAVTEKWEFRYVVPGALDANPKFPHKLSNNVKVDDRWSEDVVQVLRAAAA